MTFGKALLAATALVGLGVSPAMATVTTYNSKASFMAANTPAATATFGGIAPAGGTKGITSGSTVSGISLSSYFGGTFIYAESSTSTANPSLNVFGEDFVYENIYSGQGYNKLTITLPNTVNYIGFESKSATAGAGVVSAYLTVNGSVTQSAGNITEDTSTNPAYTGYYSNVGFNGIQFTISSAFAIDQISYGTGTSTTSGGSANDTGTAVPESGTLALVGGAFLAMIGMLGFARKREAL